MTFASISVLYKYSDAYSAKNKTQQQQQKANKQTQNI